MDSKHFVSRDYDDVNVEEKDEDVDEEEEEDMFFGGFLHAVYHPIYLRAFLMHAA